MLRVVCKLCGSLFVTDRTTRPYNHCPTCTLPPAKRTRKSSTIGRSLDKPPEKGPDDGTSSPT